MTHAFHQIYVGNSLGSCVRKLKPQYIEYTHFQMTFLHICPSQNSLHNHTQGITSNFINTMYCSFQIMEKFYGRVVVGDVLCEKKIRGGST